jgi:hypothetical protein
LRIRVGKRGDALLASMADKLGATG